MGFMPELQYGQKGDIGNGDVEMQFNHTYKEISDTYSKGPPFQFSELPWTPSWSGEGLYVQWNLNASVKR